MRDAADRVFLGSAGRNSVCQDLSAGCCKPHRFPCEPQFCGQNWSRGSHKVTLSATIGCLVSVLGSLFALEEAEAQGTCGWCCAGLGEGQCHQLPLLCHSFATNVAWLGLCGCRGASASACVLGIISVVSCSRTIVSCSCEGE